MKTFYIYFSSLTDDAQKDLLNLLGIKDPSEMNWDMDVIPLAMVDFEEEPDKEDEE